MQLHADPVGTSFFYTRTRFLKFQIDTTIYLATMWIPSKHRQNCNREHMPEAITAEDDMDPRKLACSHYHYCALATEKDGRKWVEMAEGANNECGSVDVIAQTLVSVRLLLSAESDVAYYMY
jgi:hypothetical protein